MTTKAKSTKGLKLMRGDGATVESFTVIAEVTNLKGPQEKVGTLDATSFDSTAMEFIAALNEPGDVSFDCNFIGSDAGQQGLRTDLRAGTLRNFKIIVNDHTVSPTTVAFAAIVTSAPELAGAVNAILKTSCSLKVSGQPTWTYAPSV